MKKNKEISLPTIPKEIIEHHIAPYLGLTELSRLARTYKENNHFQGLFQKTKQLKLNQLLKLLELVVFGKQDEAEEILKQYRDLLFLRGTVTDYSGRTFKDITAFQCALWALDRHMWTMLRKYLPENEARKQLQEHVYGNRIYKTHHKSHYDFEPLITALRALAISYQGWSPAQRNDHLCKEVGGAQCMVPAHVANEYCREDRLFSPVPKFDDLKKLPRSLCFVSGREFKFWFPLKKGEGLGVDTGLLRNWMPLSQRTLSDTGPALDLVAIIALRDARKKEFNLLVKELLGVDLKQDSEQELNSTLEKSSFCRIL